MRWIRTGLFQVALGLAVVSWGKPANSQAPEKENKPAVTDSKGNTVKDSSSANHDDGGSREERRKRFAEHHAKKEKLQTDAKDRQEARLAKMEKAREKGKIVEPIIDPKAGKGAKAKDNKKGAVKSKK